MDEDHVRQCARYVGLNPVGAGLVERAVDWAWSSVAAHVRGRGDGLLTAGPLAERIGPDMARFFEVDVEAEALRKLRRASTTGWPLGAAAWVKALEASTGRTLAPAPIGRPPSPDGAGGLNASVGGC